MQQEHGLADRAMLQRLLQEHPEWSRQELAQRIGRSLGWVKKWKKRLREAPARDASVLFGKPFQEVQIDFKSVSSVPADPVGKQQHVVEVFNFVDAGTSILLNAQVSADFHAQTVLEAVLSFLQTYGCPHQMTFDRDPRFVGDPRDAIFPPR